MYSFLEQIDVDAFSSRIRGSQWLGDPELFGSTVLVRINDKLKIGSHYINTFEMKSTSNTDVSYYNPVLTAKVIYSDKLYEKNIRLILHLREETSKRGWEGDGFAPEIKGTFFSSLFKSKINNSSISFAFKYVDTDFRSIGAQTRRLQYLSSPTYPFYSNNCYSENNKPVRYHDGS